MSDQKDSPDFFTDRTMPLDSDPPNPVQPSQTPANAARWKSQVKGWHVGLASGAVGLLWAFHAATGNSADHAVPKASASNPAASRYADDLDANPPAAGSSSPSVPRVVDTPVPGPTVGAGSLPSAAAIGPGPAHNDIARSLEAIQTQVASLTAALEADRSQRAACPVPSVTTTSTRLNIVHASPPRTARSVQQAAPRKVLNSYRLNTIFDGQAWIESNGQTFVVEKGGYVDGARVERIDAKAHMVVTDLGEIR